MNNLLQKCLSSPLLRSFSSNSPCYFPQTIIKSFPLSRFFATVSIFRIASNPDLAQIMRALACLLIPQAICPQSLVIKDTRLLRKMPCETHILRNHHPNSCNIQVKFKVKIIFYILHTDAKQRKIICQT